MLMAWGLDLTVSQFIGESPLEPQPSPEQAELDERLRQMVALDPYVQRLQRQQLVQLERNEELHLEIQGDKRRIAELEKLLAARPRES
jgi:hypothetical protein